MPVKSHSAAPPSRGAIGIVACGLAVIAIVAFASVIYASRFGLATSADSARYVRWARQMTGREKSPALAWSPAEQAHFPPLYPLLLAGLSRANVDPLSAARWLNAALFAINTILAGVIVMRATGCASAALFAAIAMLVSPTCVVLHAWALSESLFIAFMLGAITAIARGMESPRFGIFAGAGLLVSAATLTRYAGIALLPPGAILILWLIDRPLMKRVGLAAVFCACAIALPAGWAIRNALVLGSATHRVLALHLISSRHLNEAIQTVCGWFWTTPGPAAKLAAALIVAAVLLVGVRVAWRSGGRGPIAPLALLLLLFIGSFALLLIASISLIDFHTPLDARICAPIYVGGLVLAALELALAMRCPRRCAIAAIFAAIAFVGLAGERSVHTLIDLHQSGGGFSRRIWRDSPTMRALAALPNDELIYSNAPGAIYLVTGRASVLSIPSSIDLSSRRINQAYAEELQKMQNDLHGRAAIAYFDRYGGGQAWPSAPTWRGRLKLKMIAHRSDGAIYVGAAP